MFKVSPSSLITVLSVDPNINSRISWTSKIPSPNITQNCHGQKVAMDGMSL